MNKLQQKQENKWRQMRQVRQLSTTKTNAPNDTISPTHMLLSLFISLVHNLPPVFDNSQTRKNTPQELCAQLTVILHLRELFSARYRRTTLANPLGSEIQKRAALENGNSVGTFGCVLTHLGFGSEPNPCCQL